MPRNSPGRVPNSSTPAMAVTAARKSERAANR